MPVLSLRVRMLLLVLLAVVPALGLVLYSGLEARYQEGARAREQVLQLVQRISYDQEQAIKETRQLLITLAQLPAARERDAEACSRILGGISRLHVRYANLGAIRPDGSVFCSAVRVSASPNARDSGWFRQALRTRDFSVSQFHFGGITGRPVLTMAYPVLGGGEVAAVVFASLDLAWLNRYLSESLLPPGSVLAVMDRHGTLLARYPDPEFWVGENIGETPLAWEILTHPQGGVTEARGMDDIPRLYAYAPLAPALTQGVYVYVGIPGAVAYAEPERVLRRNLLGLGLVALLAIAAAWWGGAFLLRRAQPLLAATRRLAAGDLAARSGIDYGVDEIGQVARSFDHMAKALLARDQALHESQAKLEKAQEVAHIGSWVSTPTPAGGQLAWSRETCRIFGLAEDRFDNRIETFLAMVHPEDLEAVREANRAALAGDKSYDIEHRVVRPDGSVRWVHAQADIVRDAEGRTVSMVGVVQDVTERKTSEERIQYLAYYDALTGLPNRALFEDRLRHAVIDADRRERLVGVMFLDVDRFKDVNDSLGHETGDRLLKAVAERLTAVVRKGDTVARLGGDEFTVILAGMAHVDDAAHVAQKILEVFEQPFHVAQREFHMTASVGITLYPFDDSNSSHLLRNADIAMYRAKEAGRNTYQFYTAEMTAKASERLTLKNDLQRAFKQHEFSLVYQPIVDSGGNILGVEALLRWQHPEHGLIEPDQFIGLAEETGLIVALGEWVLRAACQQCAAWHRRGFPDLQMAVNLSARQFRHAHLAGTVQTVLEQTGLDARRLELELTESVLLEHDETTAGSLRTLSNAGVSLVIDDFGIGYSSLSYLRRFPIRTLKIDRSFTRGIPADPDSSAIAVSIVTLAHSLGMKVVAEGVETAEQFEFLRRQGCDAYQGFRFSKPLPPDDMERLLTTGFGIVPARPSAAGK
jgi:diguanylate cyclase (GGDEF)-like protein/PAS domain S-box-containing protein